MILSKRINVHKIIYTLAKISHSLSVIDACSAISTTKFDPNLINKQNVCQYSPCKHKMTHCPYSFMSSVSRGEKLNLAWTMRFQTNGPEATTDFRASFLQRNPPFCLSWTTTTGDTCFTCENW